MEHVMVGETAMRFAVRTDEGPPRSSAQRRVDQVHRAVGLRDDDEDSWSPCEKGTSFFTTGYSEKLEIPGQSESFQEWKESADMNSDFPFMPHNLMHVRTV